VQQVLLAIEIGMCIGRIILAIIEEIQKETK
jgi:hypothetical protein